MIAFSFADSLSSYPIWCLLWL